MTVTREFQYKRAGSIEEASELLASLGDEGRALAGGHSLIPTMKVRLAAPATLVDLGGIPELEAIVSADGGVRVGAMATHTSVAESTLVRETVPALASAAERIGDLQVRNRGTLGGSLAHADPAADYPALVLALDATIETATATVRRSIPADEFFTGMFSTALGPNELIVSVTFPATPGAAYAKWANPASRYAVAGVAVALAGASGQCTAARVAVTGAAATPFRIAALEEALTSRPLSDLSVEAVVADAVNPQELLSDSAASAQYRAHLVGVMAARACAEAAGAAGI